MTNSTELLNEENTPDNHSSGFVAVIGRPNVGKSTLMNHYLGQKIAIVSPKAQTTRNRLLGILTLPSEWHPQLSEHCSPAQIVFMDTPGIHKPHHRLGEFLVKTTLASIPDADVILWLVDASRTPTHADALVAQMLRENKLHDQPVILALNKIDKLLPKNVTLGTPEARPYIDLEVDTFMQLYPANVALPISATQGDNCMGLLQLIIDLLPPGPRYFPEEQVTDLQLRFIAAEFIREAALQILSHEVPHAIAVGVTEFKERSETLTYINANVVVERESQKKIVIGKKGQTLKEIGKRARKEIESMLDQQVYLDLWVKVRPKWRKKKNELRWLGYSLT